MNRFNIFLFFAGGFTFLFSINSIAQDRCGTVAYEQLQHPEVKDREQQFEQWMQSKINVNRLRTFGTEQIQSGTYIIPVVVHIIHNGEPIGTGGNLSVAQINSQIQVLNDDYNRNNADASSTPSVFAPLAGSLSIQFVLAKQDPNGVSTNGITRTLGTKSSWTLSDDAQFKALSYWPAENYLNLWVVNLSGALIGFATLPQSTQVQGLEDSEDNRLTDGVIVHYKAFGTGAGFDLYSQFNKGRTATHEIGHFFGLRHIWGDANCATDYVDDTPFQTTSTNGCPTHPQASCDAGTKPYKMFQNFMDYTNDACMNLFTANQAARMTVIIENSPRRLSLLSSPGAVLPGNEVNDVELTQINSPALVHCVTNPTIRFNIKNSSTSAVTSFQVQSAVNNGPIMTKNFNNVLIDIGDEKQFELSGLTLAASVNTVALTIINPNGIADKTPANNTKSLKTYVDVSTDIAPFRLTFDNAGEVPWLAANVNSPFDWQRITTNKAGSVYYNSFNDNTILGNESWFVSPVLDFSANTKHGLFFDVSYALRPSFDDRLRVVASEDCGLSYNTILFDESASIFSVKDFNASWKPSTDADWKKQYINLDDFSGKKNVRLAFILTNGNGNNLYLDNIEVFADDSSVPIVPEQPYRVYYTSINTMSDLALSFNLPQRKDVHLQIVSLMGQVVSDHVLENTINQTYYFDFASRASGLYLFRLQIDGQVSTTKVFIGH